MEITCIEPPSVLVRHTAAELRALDQIPHPCNSSDVREREAICVALDVDIPDPVECWIPTAVRWEGDDAFLVELATGQADTVLRGISGQMQTVLVRPEIWRNTQPWFTALRVSAVERMRRMQSEWSQVLAKAARACGPGPDRWTHGDNLVVRIVVPKAAPDEAVFAVRIAYEVLPSIGHGCPGFPVRR